MVLKPEFPPLMANLVSNQASSSATASTSRLVPVTLSHSVPVVLNDSNFLLWKHQILVAIRGNKLQGFLRLDSAPAKFLSTTDEANQSFNPAYLEWKQQDQSSLHFSDIA
ncbi:hypothetical protein PanWU01x14_258430 [Parasponia andersonii]|uniref:Retrotransposon Copia-like N-terminal domain-containing protein n=1 Tax=Parasponia andersonii TaxID=3476 RepID=A0A2P5B9K6_PARAD|nr:hypothetical protein PanWU01x14_258430 [Parasponia andersonii]